MILKPAGRKGVPPLAFAGRRNMSAEASFKSIMDPRKIVILGSTGSIGRSTVDVLIQHPGKFQVVALGAHSNAELLAEQYRQFHPRYICLIDPEAASRLKANLKDEPVEILVGEEEMIGLAGLAGVDIVLNAVVGAAGLRVSLEAVKSGKYLALANKESLVAGGPLFPELCKRTDARILPVDSEHSAIWQALASGKQEEVKKLILTASGGPFRTLPPESFADITVEQALNHPTWNMGRKITIDSATLANKGLEVLEAVVLFSMPPERIEVVVHPQSIIHSMVEFQDSSIIAQLSNPDMRLPIAYALFWPDRPESSFGQIDWSELQQITFEKPDYKRFPILKLAYEVARTGGTAPAVFNAANETAVEAFLNEEIKFTEIADTIRETVEGVASVARPQLEDIIEADRRAREHARHTLEKIAC